MAHSIIKMKGSITLIATVLVALLGSALASRLIHEQVETFVRILRDGFGRNEVDVEGIVQLMHLMDGNPKYNKAALQFIANKLGQRSLSFDVFEKVIEAIYGDQISEDPFQPQEVHIALGNDINTMKVQWVTMSTLQNPIVEYTTDVNCATWSDAHTASATSYTYTVPQKWWPVFNGMIDVAASDAQIVDNLYYTIDMQELGHMNVRQQRIVWPILARPHAVPRPSRVVHCWIRRCNTHACHDRR
ncbi:hypothetical protein EON65_49215, partial [archaeon]